MVNVQKSTEQRPSSPLGSAVFDLKLEAEKLLGQGEALPLKLRLGAEGTFFTDKQIKVYAGYIDFVDELRSKSLRVEITLQPVQNAVRTYETILVISAIPAEEDEVEQASE